MAVVAIYGGELPEQCGMNSGNLDIFAVYCRIEIKPFLLILYTPPSTN